MSETTNRDLLNVNLQAERDHFVALVLSLLDTYRPEGVVIWLKSHNRNLGDTPRRMIARGEWQALHDEAERLAGGPS